MERFLFQELLAVDRDADDRLRGVDIFLVNGFGAWSLRGSGATLADDLQRAFHVAGREVIRRRTGDVLAVYERMARVDAQPGETDSLVTKVAYDMSHRQVLRQRTLWSAAVLGLILGRAEMLGMPHAWPKPDPIVQDRETFQVSAEQPYIYWLTCLGVEAERRDRGIEFAYEVSQLIFGGTRYWDPGEHMAGAAARAGLDLAVLEAAIGDLRDHLAEVEANQRALEAAGHRGVPTFVFNGEPFFGQDRIDTLRWRLDQAGLARR